MTHTRKPPPEPPRCPLGHVYVRARITLTAPAGVPREKASFIPEGNLRNGLVAMLAAFPQWHSGLQEPHGGEKCVAIGMWRDDPHDPARRAPTTDPPRRERGMCVVAVTVTSADGTPRADITGTARECTLRTDMHDLILELPETAAGLDSRS